MLVLGIETSCDETAAAVVENGTRVLSNVIGSQAKLHEKYGGVVPEIASRAHVECMDAIIQEALTRAQVTQDQIDGIAVTRCPGLVGSLVIGVAAAKTLSWLWNKPLIGVDHVLAHAYSPAIGLDAPPWPAVALIVSGGHTSLYHVKDFDTIELLGATTDDAAGEAFDKVASLLGLGYPGGPIIDKLAQRGDPKAIEFPRTLLGRDSLDFSFSGIKTAVLYHVHGTGKTQGGLEKLSEQDLCNIAASFQQAVVDVLVIKAMRAAARVNAKAVVLGGGVAANSSLRKQLGAVCEERRMNFHAAKMEYCLDNAAMIAALGFHMLCRGERSGLDLDAAPHSVFVTRR